MNIWGLPSMGLLRGGVFRYLKKNKACVFSVIWRLRSRGGRKCVLRRISFLAKVQRVRWVFDISQETMHLISAPLIFSVEGASLFEEEMRPRRKANGWNILDASSLDLPPRGRASVLRGAWTGHCEGVGEVSDHTPQPGEQEALEQQTSSPADTIIPCFDC